MSFTVNGTSLEAEGILVELYETQQVTATFKKREFAIEFRDGQYPNFATFQLIQDKCDIIDGYQKGEAVKVSFNIRGNKYEKNGVVRYITSLTAWRLSKSTAGAGPNAAAPAPIAMDPPTSDAGFDQGAPFDGGDLPF
jgi:single-strand DNA-binding protein